MTSRTTNKFSPEVRARAGIAAWIRFYNGGRPHQALGDRIPMVVWREGVYRRTGRQRCGHNASLGRRYRVAHMPTAITTATAADDLRRVIKEVGADPASNQERPSDGPHLGVHFNPLELSTQVALARAGQCPIQTGSGVLG